MHDFGSLVASIRHKARSIAEVVREHMSRRSYLLFLSFIWIALVYIIVAFTDITAAAFVGAPNDEAGGVGGGAIATSSLLYLVLPIVMGLLMRYAKMPLWLATVIFLPLVGVAIWVGQYIPFDVQVLAGFSADKVGEANARKVWDVALCCIAWSPACVPVWMLLQPRGHLGGYFLYAALGAAPSAWLWAARRRSTRRSAASRLSKPAERRRCFRCCSSSSPAALLGLSFADCVGHDVEQLRVETDAKSIGYGAMLLEGMVAIVSLCCVMMFAAGSSELSKEAQLDLRPRDRPFLEVVRIDRGFGIAFRADGLHDVRLRHARRLHAAGAVHPAGADRLARAIGRWFGTGLTAGVPLFFLLRHPADAAQPVWQIFWNLFGASNQLLAALTLLGVTVWLWRTRRSLVGLARHRRADGVHVRDEHVGMFSR